MPLVSVIIPAHNAESTISETVGSALRQTHSDLEVIIVDDGSSDRTLALCDNFKKRDARVRVFSKANAGVANARNIGIDNACGEFIAPLDADDLWHPSKIERQLERFAKAAADVALVYNWFRWIDMTGRVVRTGSRPSVEGWALHRHLMWNFISNGSTPLIRRKALADLRYDRALHAAGNQGCEDYLLQLQLAMRAPFACVPAFLTGYRRSKQAMSGDAARMIRSHIQVYEILAPHLGKDGLHLARGRMAAFHVQYLRNRLKRGLLKEAFRAGAEALRTDRRAAIESLWGQLVLALGAPKEQPIDRRHFDEWQAEEGGADWQYARSRRLQQLEWLDQSCNEAGAA